jgi:hypothetical protein
MNLKRVLVNIYIYIYMKKTKHTLAVSHAVGIRQHHIDNMMRLEFYGRKHFFS